ncbi:MAG: NRDE family protein [Porticoccaceae bacterium]|nr:NRDE family protein [Porticoccaceae bacterium]
MCLLAIAFNSHPDTPLAVCSNRDEFYQRPTLPMHWWQDKPVLAGRDEQEGGTWMGLSRNSRFAAVTNFREFSKPGFHEARPKSRGNLVTDFLCSEASARSWAESMLPELDLYGGFNLLIYDGEQLLYLNNFNNQLRSLEPGIYALSNHLLDSPWPKVDYARQQLSETLKRQNSYKSQSDQQILRDLLGLLEKNQTYADHLLPNTGVPADWEKRLSSAFIVAEDYGTRASTSIVLSNSGSHIAEQTYIEGVAQGSEIFTF